MCKQTNQYKREKKKEREREREREGGREGNCVCEKGKEFV